MQLVLADTTDTRGRAKQLEDGVLEGFYFPDHVEVKRPTETEDVDFNDPQRNLLAEMTLRERCSIEGILFGIYSGKMFSTRHYNLALCDGKGKVLRNLWERFQEKVSISVEINSATPNGNTVRCISATGMALAAIDDDFSEACCPIYKFRLALGDSFFRVKITADISDDLVVVSNAYQLKKTNVKMLEEGVASDVIIEAENGVEIKGHRCFLIASSSVFERMFASGMAEARKGRIDMSDLSGDGVRAFLRYLYLGDVIVPNASIVVAYDLMYAAHKYDVPRLEATMMTYFLGRKDEDFDVILTFEIFMFVKVMGRASELKEKIMGILQMKFDELKEIKEFKEVLQKNPSDVMEIYCNLEYVSLPEMGELTPKQNDMNSQT